MTNSLLSDLNPSQKKAASHTNGPLLVVAGAGSGKTRTLTFRIANLILHQNVDAEEILAVTFTNKAAREMKDRIDRLFIQQQLLEGGVPNHSLESLSPAEQTEIKSIVYKKYTKKLWIGTFHSLCARILRFDIEKYQNEDGKGWLRNFTIFDESDVHSLIKEIVVKDLQLDEKKFDPKGMRYAISGAKNRCWSPADYLKNEGGYKAQTVFKVYQTYQQRMLANNALDFDDLIFVPVQLFRQQPKVLSYWHDRFKHILVDEYQDTNRTQYELIRLLVTNNQDQVDWSNRSVFVVGDADQSIYSFRLADFKILMEFQDAFGDGLPDDQTQTMVKLEENYRSVSNILEVANELISNNTQRIEKILKATIKEGDVIRYFNAPDEGAEANYVIDRIKEQIKKGKKAGDCAILYRTNAQSRTFEEVLVRNNINYRVVGGMRFYDRKEIKDILAYLRVLVNPNDRVSLLRIINVPRRGIGKETINRLVETATELDVPLFELLQRQETVRMIASRAARSVQSFIDQMTGWMSQMNEKKATDLIRQIIEESGYQTELQQSGTNEDLDRLDNLQELVNAAAQYGMENEDDSLEGFLANAALSSADEGTGDNEEKVTLMTLHGAKGLEFPVVFLVGLEQGLFPSYRSLDNPADLEEERRLMYVGITRAKEKLFLTSAQERRLYGNSQYAVKSQFLDELPQALILEEGKPRVKQSTKVIPLRPKLTTTPNSQTNWQIGDKVSHKEMGIGTIEKIIGSSKSFSLVVKFNDRVKQILAPSSVEKV
jgi:DNA helicase-2/ATP-dependent DNA helicase PcrA